MRKKEEPVVAREQAMIGDVLVVKVPIGTPIYDAQSGRLLGIVGNSLPVINGQTCYLSEDDYEAAKAALPAAPGVTRH